MPAAWKWAGALLLCAAAAQCAPWTFRADFHHGFNGWMSYPLPQDIGFDPSLTVEEQAGESVLVREVASAGERELSTGFIRPLHCFAGSATRVRLRYAGKWVSLSLSLPQQVV